MGRRRSWSPAAAALVVGAAARALAADGGDAHELATEVQRLRREVQKEEQRAQAVRDSAAATRLKLSQTNSSLQDAQAELEDLRSARQRDAEVCRDAVLLCWLATLQSQGLLAVAAGLLGVAALLGPPDFRVAFSALCGSALGALLIVACLLTMCSQVWATFSAAQEADAKTLPAMLGHLALGGGSVMSNLVWLVLFLVGLLHWVDGAQRQPHRAKARPRQPEGPPPEDKAMGQDDIYAVPGDREVHPGPTPAVAARDQPSDLRVATPEDSGPHSVGPPGAGVGQVGPLSADGNGGEGEGEDGGANNGWEVTEVYHAAKAQAPSALSEEDPPKGKGILSGTAGKLVPRCVVGALCRKTDEK